MNRKNHLGKYYQKNGRFQTKKDKNSIGLCIISDYEEDVIMSFEEKTIDRKDINEESLPSYLEMTIALGKFGENLNISRYEFYWIRPHYNYVRLVSDVIRPCCVYYSDGCDGCLCVGSRFENCGPNRSRKVWRIKK